MDAGKRYSVKFVIKNEKLKNSSFTEPLQINVWRRFWNILKYPLKYVGNISMMIRMEVTGKKEIIEIY